MVLGKLSSAGNNDKNVYPYASSKGPNFANRNSVLASEQGLHNENGGESYRMRSYYRKIEAGQTIAMAKGGRGMDDGSSQKSIIMAVEPFPPNSEEMETEV
jgi:hypothetical protein